MNPDGPETLLGTAVDSSCGQPTRESSPSSGSFWPAASDGLFHLKSHIFLCCNMFNMSFRPHISHTHQTKVCLGWEKGGKEAGRDRKGAELGLGLAVTPHGAKSKEPHGFMDLREEPIIASWWSLGSQIFFPVPSLHLCSRRQGWVCHHLTRPASVQQEVRLHKAWCRLRPHPSSIVQLGGQSGEHSLDGSKLTAEQPCLSQHGGTARMWS